jgi:hypothetical protein
VFLGSFLDNPITITQYVLNICDVLTSNRFISYVMKASENEQIKMLGEWDCLEECVRSGGERKYGRHSFPHIYIEVTLSKQFTGF